LEIGGLNDSSPRRGQKNSTLLLPAALARFFDNRPASIQAAQRTAAGTRQVALILECFTLSHTLLLALSVRSTIESVLIISTNSLTLSHFVSALTSKLPSGSITTSIRLTLPHTLMLTLT